MPSYRKLDLPPTEHYTPNTPPIRPGEFTELEQAHHAIAGLDTTINSGRRVLLEAGLRGSSHFMVRDGEPTLSQSRVYPDALTPRVVARGTSIPLTPGYVVGLEVVALPSGPTQALDNNMINWEEDTRTGAVELRVTYTNAAGEVALSSALVEVEGSDEPSGAEPADPCAALILGSDLALPGPWDPDPVEWSRWTGPGVRVELELRYRGSPRIVDVVVVEYAWSSTVDVAALRRPAAFYTTDEGEPLDHPPSEYPIVRATENDRALGVESIVEAIAETGVVLGPVLWSWSSHDEADGLFGVIDYDGGTGDGEAVPVEVVGDNWTHLASSIVTNSAAAPGLLAGNYAPGLRQSNTALVARRTGLIPVWVAAYWQTSEASSPALLELSTSPWSTVALSTSSTAWAWTIVPAWLEVGPNPEARTTAHVRWRSAQPDTRAKLRNFAVFYRLS